MNGRLRLIVLGSTTGKEHYGFADTRRTRRQRQAPLRRLRSPARRRRARLASAIATAGAVIAIVVVFVVQGAERPAQAVRPHPPRGRAAMPAMPGSYIGVYRTGVPDSYAG